ncbi:MAG TPA: hypothetical protein VII72_18975 [Myxococcota bacterium]
MTGSRWLWLALLWAVTAGLLFAIYRSGATSYHRYEDTDGWGLNQERYIGEDLAKEIRGGERYRYVGVRRVFDRDPGPRTFAAAVILPVAVLVTIRLVRPRPGPTPPPPPS